MKFLHTEDASKELTFEDVFLMPQYTEVASRMDVDATPVGGLGTRIPLVVSNMNAVAGRRMAESVTRRGGLVVLPQDMATERITDIAAYIQSRHTIYETPVQLHEHESIQTALALINKRSHGAIIVVDDEQKPVGIFTEYDAKFRDRFGRLRDAMSTDMITHADGASISEMFHVMKQRRVPVMPIIDALGTLKGVVTTKGLVRSSIYQPAVNASGKLVTAAAIGINQDVGARIRNFLEAGVDVIVLDTAHGHQKKMVDAIKEARAILGADRPLIAGNVVSVEATRDLIAAGASLVKVGVGPGAMCTTRMMTGMGRPQWSAIYECAKVARAMGAGVIADGGIRHPRDIVLALVAGASQVMFGSLFAGTYESPADMMRDEKGKLYKENFGMASRRAVVGRGGDEGSLESMRKQYFDEGISQSRMYLNEGQESVEDIIDRIMAGVRSACSYTGARNLEELYEKAVIGVQTRAGFDEGKPVATSW